MNVAPSTIVKEALIDRYGWRAEWGPINAIKPRPFSRVSRVGMVAVPACLYELLMREAKARRVPANKLLGAITSAYLRRLQREEEARWG
jgi:hypothetical protein